MDIVFTPEENVALSWISSNPDVLSNTGKYTAPKEESSFTMTARLECGNFYWQKELSAKAPADPSSIVELSTTGQGTDDSDESIYDLTGRRVDAPTQGLYLIKGKKVWIAR